MLIQREAYSWLRLRLFQVQASQTSTHKKVFMSHCGKLATPSATLRMIPALNPPFKLHEILEYSRDRISAGFATILSAGNDLFTHLAEVGPTRANWSASVHHSLFERHQVCLDDTTAQDSAAKFFACQPTP